MSREFLPSGEISQLEEAGKNDGVFDSTGSWYTTENEEMSPKSILLI